MTGLFSFVRPTIECMFVISRDSSISSWGRMVAKAFASMVFPEPGGPIINMLWPPAAAISSARFPCSLPRMCWRSFSVISFGVKFFRNVFSCSSFMAFPDRWL